MNQLNTDIKLGKTGNSPVLSGTWDPQSGKLYINGSGLRDVLVYDPATESVRAFDFPGPVVDMAFAPSGSRSFVLYSETFDEKALIVNWAYLTSVALPKPADLENWGISQRACWTPDGSQIATWNFEENPDPTLRIFSATREKELFERPNPTYSAAACDNIRLGAVRSRRRLRWRRHPGADP